MPLEQDRTHWAFFFPRNHDYKGYHALDLLFDELNLRLRSEGEARAQIERTVLVERAVEMASLGTVSRSPSLGW